jgi:hypothetical protein
LRICGSSVEAGDQIDRAATENSQRATMLTPQGLDATHGAELFPVNESCAAASVAPGAMLPSLLLATREKHRADRTEVEILGTARGHGSVAMKGVCRIYGVRRFG